MVYKWTTLRWVKVDNGKQFELYGPLNIDVFNIDRYLINGVLLSLKLYPHRGPFSLMSESPEKGYRIIIDQAILQVKLLMCHQQLFLPMHIH